MNYEDLLIEADSNNLITKEKNLLANKGRIKGKRIAIKKDLLQKEKACVLAEELGHFYTTTGDILSQETVLDIKQGQRARAWAYNKQIGLIGVVSAYEAGCSSLYDTAEYLNVTEDFLLDCLEFYRKKYGICKKIDNYIIYFEPNLGIFEII